MIKNSKQAHKLSPKNEANNELRLVYFRVLRKGIKISTVLLLIKMDYRNQLKKNHSIQGEF